VAERLINDHSRDVTGCVELEHRRLDRHGPCRQFVADGVGRDQGWPLYLARYAALFDQEN
jgi:hypothetical protein